MWKDAVMFYDCDPEKNTACSKTNCAKLRPGLGERGCSHTLKKECSTDGVLRPAVCPRSE